ncbi:glycosyltransferase [candidate division KSB1 bacterium]|nr:glycosyltransferase [candidate division KSB1 bacterium]
MPLVSIIIPTFNRKVVLAEAIDSVFNQSFKDFELIVVDDGSSDGTREMLGNYGSRIRCFFQENRGPSVARNLGIHNSNGLYISFLDSDDLWLRNKLSTQINLMSSNSDTQICYSDEIWIRNGIRVNQKKRHRKYGGWIFEYCLALCIISPSSVLMHRDIFDHIGMFDENLIVCEDYELWLRTSLHYPIAFINEPLIIKRGGHKDQLSRKYWGMDRFRIAAIEKTLTQQNLTARQRTAAIEMLSKMCRIVGNGYLKRGKTAEANHFLSLPGKYHSS